MWYLVVLMIVACAGFAPDAGTSRHAAAVPTPDEAWELVKNEGGIAVYNRTPKGKDYSEYKGVVRFKASLAGVVSLLEDIRSYPSWLYTCHEARVLKNGKPGERYVHFVYDVPVYSNRDAVMRSCASRRADGNGATIRFSRVDLSQTAPFFRHASTTRDDGNEYVKELSVTWQLTRIGNEVEVMYSIYLDPDIGFPGSLRVNATTEGLVFESLKKMRGKLGESVYLNASPRVVEALPVNAPCS